MYHVGDTIGYHEGHGTRQLLQSFITCSRKVIGIPLSRYQKYQGVATGGNAGVEFPIIVGIDQVHPTSIGLQWYGKTSIGINANVKQRWRWCDAVLLLLLQIVFQQGPLSSTTIPRDT
eukprot:scaffold5935_cov237-Amphora_coffeaeformis.AAC.3